MKKMMLLLFLTSSGQAFTSHNYYEETCAIKTPKNALTVYKYFYWQGSHFTVTTEIPNLPQAEIYLPGHEGSTDDDPITGEEAMTFINTKDSEEERTDYDDGCWQGFNAHFTRSSTIDKINTDLTNFTGSKSGDVIEMECDYDHLVMTGDHCN